MQMVSAGQRTTSQKRTAGLGLFIVSKHRWGKALAATRVPLLFNITLPYIGRSCMSSQFGLLLYPATLRCRICALPVWQAATWMPIRKVSRLETFTRTSLQRALGATVFPVVWVFYDQY